jgi:hypothetical protein
MDRSSPCPRQPKPNRNCMPRRREVDEIEDFNLWVSLFVAVAAFILCPRSFAGMPSQKSLTKIQTWISSRLLVRWLTRGHASTAKRCSTRERSEFQHYFIRTSSRNMSTVRLSWRSWGIRVTTSWKLFIARIKFGRGRPQGRSRPRRPASNKRLLPPRKLTVRSLL